MSDQVAFFVVKRLRKRFSLNRNIPQSFSFLYLFSVQRKEFITFFPLFSCTIWKFPQFVQSRPCDARVELKKRNFSRLRDSGVWDAKVQGSFLPQKERQFVSRFCIPFRILVILLNLAPVFAIKTRKLFGTTISGHSTKVPNSCGWWQDLQWQDLQGLPDLEWTGKQHPLPNVCLSLFNNQIDVIGLSLPFFAELIETETMMMGVSLTKSTCNF